ncbi:MAG: right-handed parallel beta-helix repeat-containing protein [Candidatus Hydrogenedentes bacterium]|nr:right-handed parallel beta-helix repeat-containing protein [Candidatus Hydrogenedentota bacterium]
MNKDNVSGMEDGLSWATAFTTVQPAINAAYAVYTNLGDRQELWVAEGIYDEPRTSVVDTDAREDVEEIANTGSIVMRPGLDMYGGFGGTETQRDQRNVEAHESVLDGSRSRDGSAATAVVLGADDVVLDGFTIRGCTIFDQVASWDLAGAVYNLDVSPTISHCKFTSNRAYVNGASALKTTQGSNALISECTFTENIGAVSIRGDTILSGCVFSNNSGQFSSPALSMSGNAAVEYCVFLDNYSQYGITGAVSIGGTATLWRCSFHGNRSGSGFGNDDRGGAVSVGSGQVKILDSTFVNNAARFGGAIYFYTNASAEVTNCIFYNNSATTSGAVGLNTVTCDDYGFCTGGTVQFTNCIFVGNRALDGAGGVTADPVIARFRNCILWGNTPDQIYYTWAAGLEEWMQLKVDYSLVQGGWEGIGNLDADPLFIDSSNGDLRLRAGSPAIDAGTLDGAPEVDIRGVARPQGAGVDMGAYEYQAGDEADIDASGTTDAVDVQLVINGALGLDSRAGLDVDGNGVIDAIDVQMVINSALGVG